VASQTNLESPAKWRVFKGKIEKKGAEQLGTPLAQKKKKKNQS
jgi:hypothetical protein